MQSVERFEIYEIKNEAVMGVKRNAVNGLVPRMGVCGSALISWMVGGGVAIDDCFVDGYVDTGKSRLDSTGN